MKLVVLYGLIIGVFLSFGSCKSTDDEFLPDDVLPPVPEGYVRMQITVPGLTPVSTYALSSVEETAVSTVGVLVFGSDSKYLCYAAVTEPAKITGSGSTKTFDVDLRAAGNITDAYVMVVANASVDTTGFAASQPTKETVMREKMTFASSGKWPVDGSKTFPMWGMTASPVSLAGTSSISSISLIRSVARVDVGLKFPDNVTDGTETGQGLTPSTTFTLEEVYLYNSLDRGSVAPYNGNYSGTTVTVPSIPDSPSAPGINDSPVPSCLSSNGTADGFDTNKFSCTGAIYMAEHAAGTDALTNNPYLVIGGRYGSSTADITYYRLDFVSGNYPDQEFLPVLRNHRYRFNITG
ncbi:MAG: FimB/Mfa2 family fimbrial subunit, partial [Prevotella sp.]|nr:FimB/Mfa2 family fimbrial subunit [Prevotella sp.]